MKLLLIVPLALLLSGCGFGQTFSRELSRQLADDVGAAVDSKLGDDFKGVGDGISGAMKSIPAPEKPLGPVEGGLAGLLALIAANAIKGAVRKYATKKTEG